MLEHQKTADCLIHIPLSIFNGKDVNQLEAPFICAISLARIYSGDFSSNTLQLRFLLLFLFTNYFELCT